jgi:Tfp pilus assembly protein PilF
MTRRATLKLLAFAAILGPLISPVAAQEPRLGVPPSVEASLKEMWFARARALVSNDTVAAASAVDSMKSLVRAERLDRVPWLARAFSFEGNERMREGNYERAREAFDIARRFDSRAPEPQTGYAWAALRAGRGIGPFVQEYRRALWLRWDAFTREGKANALITTIVALWALCAVAVLILVLKYNTMLRHDVAEWLPAPWADSVSRVAGWVVLFAPLLVWIGGAWLLLYWCVVLARYMSTSERVAAVLACLAIVATGPLAEQSAREARHAADPTLLAMQEALDGGYGKDVIHFLQTTLEEDPDSVVVRLLLANTYQRASLNREAFEEYQRILDRASDEPRALNNIGSLYMKTGQAGQGLVYFGRAVEGKAERPEIFHNLHLAQSAALRLDDAEGSLRQLQQLDPNLAAGLMKSRSRGEEPEPIPLWVSREEVTRYLEERMGDGRALKVSSYFGSPTAIGAMAAIFLLGWSAMLSRSPSRAQICIRCGDPFCGKCKREIGARECCAQCIHLFVKKEAIAPDVRAAKLRQVERFERVTRLRLRIATLIFPGAGHLLSGSTFGGLFAAILWVFPLAALLLRGRLILPPSVGATGASTLFLVLAGSLMAFAWISANLLLPRTRA